MAVFHHILAFIFGLVLPRVQVWPRASDAAEEPAVETWQDKRQTYWGTATVHTALAD